VELKRMVRINEGMRAFVLILILLISLDSGVSLLTLQSLGYSTGFQNPRAKFAGVKYKDKTFTSMALYHMPIDQEETEEASMARFDTSLRFDPDNAKGGKPNIHGEMTPVFIPEESLAGFATWMPSEWLKTASVIKNPQREYAWNISGKEYRMEQWVLKFYMSFSAEWDDWENPQVIHELLGVTKKNYFSNTEIWLEFDLTPTWYIEGGGTAYFAIGKIQLSDIEKSAEDNEGKEVEVSKTLSVTPESVGGIMYVYYGLFGAGHAETEAKTFDGKKLNPDLFTDKVYAHFDLNNFGVEGTRVLFGQDIEGDVVTVGFDITVFVIGEWDVKDIQKIPEDFGRTAKTDISPTTTFFNSPEGRLLMLALAGMALLLILAIFAPTVLLALFAIFGDKRRR